MPEDKPTNECPKFESEAWKSLPENEKKRCNESRLTANTTEFLVFNSFNLIIGSIISGFVLVLALLIIEPLQTQFAGYQIYWFVLIIFGFVILLAVAQFFIDKKKNYYKRQIDE